MFKPVPIMPLETQQSGNPEYPPGTHQQWSWAIANSSTGITRAFFAHSGSDYFSYSRSKTSGEVAKTTDIDITGPAMPGQPVDEPASEQSEKSSDDSLTSTAS